MVRKGKCGNRDSHKGHFHDSMTLGHYWCLGVKEKETNDDGKALKR